MPITISDITISTSRAWAVYSVTAGVLTVHESFNLTMVRSALGIYNCTFVTPMPSTYYSIALCKVGVMSYASSGIQAAWQSTTGFNINPFENGASQDIQAPPHYSSVIVY